MTSEPQLLRLARLDCCAVSDALDKLNLPGLVSGLPPLTVPRRIAGPVVTVKLGTGKPAARAPRHLGTTAIESASAGDIIVVEQRSGIEAGCWGGILTLAARLRGVAGVIADGPVRDIDEARGHDFPVYARSCTARTARGRIVELGSHVPVRIGEVEVSPGDFAIADSSGVAFIRAQDLDRVLEAAESIAKREAAMMDLLHAGRPVSEVMGADYESMLKGD